MSTKEREGEGKTHTEAAVDERLVEVEHETFAADVLRGDGG